MKDRVDPLFPDCCSSCVHSSRGSCENRYRQVLIDYFDERNHTTCPLRKGINSGRPRP
ncbi:MAG: hypothetical protein ABEK59_13335 [Halobacteria archaeon]